MLAEVQEAGQILNEEKLAFIVDSGVPNGQAVQIIIPINAAFQTEDLDTYNYDCNDISNTKAVLIANISNYCSNVISVDFGKCFVPQQELSTDETLCYHMLNPSTKSSDALPVKLEASKELPTVSLVNENLKKLKLHLANFEKVVKIRTTPNARTKGLKCSTSNGESKPIAGSENCPPMLNKENYVPWSSRLLRYAKSRPNGKLIHNSIINGPYVRRIIPEPGDPNHKVHVNETFYVQTDDELTEKELKQIKADDEAIQTILLGLPKDIYAAVDSCETAQEIWLRVQQMMKGFDIGIQKKKAKLFNEWEMFTSNDEESIESYYHHFLKLMNDLKGVGQFARNCTVRPKIRDAAYLQTQLLIAQKEEAGIQLQAEEFDLMAAAADLDEIEEVNANCILMANLQQASTSGTQIDKAPVYESDESAENVGNLNGYNIVQNVRNQNRLIGVLGNANQNGNGNLVAAHAEGNAAGHNGNQIRKRQESNSKLKMLANLQQASTSGTQTDKAPVYDSDESAEVHNYEDCYDNDIFNMFTQEEQYTELLEPIPKSHQVPHNDNNIISEVTSVEQSGETV
nr:hypothetical protein [Tanacetum cinerariifolium]